MFKKLAYFQSIPVSRGLYASIGIISFVSGFNSGNNIRYSEIGTHSGIHDIIANRWGDSSA